MAGAASAEDLLRLPAEGRRRVTFKGEDKEADKPLEPTPEALQKRIDEIGFGPAQLVAVLCCGGIMASEGSEVLIMGSITTLLADEWHLGPFMRGFMTSIVFVGFSLGNLISGSVGDSLGRRPAILLAYSIIFVSGLLTSLTENSTAMLLVRVFVGFGCGIGFPSVYSLVPEVSPTYLRGVKSAVLISFMPLGEFYSSLGVFLLDKELDGTRPLGYASWRALVQWSCIPPLAFFLFSCFALEESPHYLLSRGRIEELNQLMARMASWNGVPHLGATFRTDVPETEVAASGGSSTKSQEKPYSWSEAMLELIGRRYVWTTLFLFLAHFTKDFSVFGLGYVFPQYFQETAGKLSVGLEMMIISLLALPGVIVASVLSRMQSVGHIPSLSMMGGLTSLTALGLVDIFHFSFCAYFVKFFAMAYFIIVVVYSAEVFPTRIRITAIGLCAGVGRWGAILSPLVFEIMKSVTSSFGPWWWMLTICSALVAIGAPICLEHETKGRALAEDDSRPLSPQLATPQYSAAA